MDKPPDVIVCGQRRHGARRHGGAEGAATSPAVAIIGFDALPEALAAVRDGSLTATVEQFPGGQSRGAVQALVGFLRDGKKPRGS